MIVFVPGYDPETTANLVVAEQIRPASCHALLAQGATREALLAALATIDAPVFAMSPGAVHAPDPSPELLPLFVEIFRYIRDAFARAGSRQERTAILVRIAELCHEAESRLDEQLEADPGLDAGPAYFCLLHIWQRLRVWGPDEPAPLSHQDAPEPVLFP